jgi:uncharacterized protein (TIGR02596 family)
MRKIKSGKLRGLCELQACVPFHSKSKIQNLKFPLGFSLIELLVVVAMMGILISLLIPAFGSIGQSNQLTSASQIVIGELNKARQEAIARNRAVQVRFYTIPPKDQAANTSLKSMRAIQTVVLDERGDFGTNARYGRLAHLPSGIQISTNASLTSLVLATNGTTNLPVFGSSDYVAFRFRPNGGTDLATNSFWTLVSDRATETPPPNFATIQIDPRTGRVRLFRP